jgi:NADPH:quinone reductase-like Zn-dependent oxidoreductase
MKEAIVQLDLSVKIQEIDIPTPGPDQVVIKVAYSGSNPKDWFVLISLSLYQGVQYIDTHFTGKE